MRPWLRRLVLAVHLTLSIGWIGAVFAYLAMDVAAVSGDTQEMHAARIAMALIGQWVIVPLAVGSLLTGLITAVGTPWGLFRHYWVLISFLLTTVAVLVLVEHMPSVVAAAEAMRGSEASPLHARGADFEHAGGGLAVLLVVTVLNVYKPRGMTPYGWRRRTDARKWQL